MPTSPLLRAKILIKSVTQAQLNQVFRNLLRQFQGGLRALMAIQSIHNWNFRSADFDPNCSYSYSDQNVGPINKKLGKIRHVYILLSMSKTCIFC